MFGDFPRSIRSTTPPTTDRRKEGVMENKCRGTPGFAKLIVRSVILFFIAVPLFAMADAAKAAPKANNGVYLVRMVEDPVVAYKGGISGLKATKPARARRSIPTAPMWSNTSATSTRATRCAGQAGGAQAVRLSLYLQRLCRRAECGPGRQRWRPCPVCSRSPPMRSSRAIPPPPRPSWAWMPRRPVGAARRRGQRR